MNTLLVLLSFLLVHPSLHSFAPPPPPTLTYLPLRILSYHHYIPAYSLFFIYFFYESFILSSLYFCLPCLRPTVSLHCILSFLPSIILHYILFFLSSVILPYILSFLLSFLTLASGKARYLASNIPYMLEMDPPGEKSPSCCSNPTSDAIAANT